jgi:hypothetical protein
VLFCGLLTIPNWYMDWVLSNAHLELLICDQPIISYKKQKDKKEHTKKEMDDIMAKWEAKRKAQGKSTDFKAGEKTSLNDFLRTGMDAFNTKN